MPAAYHHQIRLLALTVRYDLFLLNMDTMEYKTFDIPILKKNMAQLSCLWKNLVFSENAEMLFLTDDKFLLGWNLKTGNYAGLLTTRFTPKIFLRRKILRTASILMITVKKQNGEKIIISYQLFIPCLIKN